MLKNNKSIGRLASGCCAAALLLATVSSTAQDSPITDQDRDNYQTVYGEKLNSVYRTRTESDDRTLAKEMMAFASQVPDDPGVQCLIYIDVLTLASNASEMAMMVQASAQLHELWPEQDAVPVEQMMQLASKAYRSVDRRDRESQGEEYIYLLLDLAERQVSAEDTELAENIYRLAGTVANSIDSEQSDFIKDQVQRMTAEREINQRIKMLKLSIEKNPQNKPVAKELVNLLIARRNDLPGALKIVDFTGDLELIDLVTRCANGIDQANAATALRVGDWYASMADDERDEQAVMLLEHARAWYERFISQYPRKDALAEHVASKQNSVAFKLEQLGAELVGPAGPVGRWVSLIAPPFAVKDHLFDEPKFLESNADQITIDDGMFAVPIPKANSYEVRVTMTTPTPEDENEERAITVGLPIGEDRFVSIRLYVRDGRVAKLSHIEGNLKIDNEPDRTNQKVQYTLQVSRNEEQTAVAVLYNGKLATSWQGNYEDLHEREEDDIRYLPLERGQVMAIRSLTVNHIHAVEFRPRD